VFLISHQGVIYSSETLRRFGLKYTKHFKKLEKLVLSKKRSALAIFSYVLVFIIFLNLTYIHSVLVGTLAFVTYFLMNGIFWGHALFDRENIFFRLTLGFLLLIVLLGLVGWLALIAYNLDILRTVLALSVVATLPLLLKIEHKSMLGSPSSSSQNKWRTPSHLYVVRLVYLLMGFFSFYLLFASKTEEVSSVWQFLNPLFMPTFFATTLILLLAIFSRDKLEYKLLFIILHSILIHTFFVIAFPAGDLSYQARILADTRSIFDNTVLHGWPPVPAENILSQIWYWFRGANFQSALSIIFARAFYVDVLWSHLLLVPFLWGLFIPVATFMVTHTLCKSERTALLSSLLIASFPLSVYYGALSVPISLGYIFFFFALVFALKYLSTDESRNALFAIAFTIISFLGHFLTGIMSFSLLLLATVVRKYQGRKIELPISKKTLLVIVFVFCLSLLPLALVYQKLFHRYGTAFSLYRFYKWSLDEVVSLLVFGEYANFWIYAAIIHVIGPTLGFLGLLYCWRSRDKQKFRTNRYLYLFFLLGFLVVLIDYRILKLFMVRVPFSEERLWVFRDFLAVPFLAILADSILTRLRSRASGHLRMILFRPWHFPSLNPNLNWKSLVVSALGLISIASYILGLLALPALTTASLYYAYPHYGPLQITSYELDAVKHIDENTPERYVVISDQWMVFAGQMIVGAYNPRAYYFNPYDPKGVAFFLEMKRNPRPEPMIEAMSINNATVAYFIIEKPRLGAEQYSRLVFFAEQNGLQTFKIFYYQEEEKLTVFRYEKSTLI